MINKYVQNEALHVVYLPCTANFSYSISLTHYFWNLFSFMERRL